MQLTIDRIENNIAVCELPDGGFVNIPVAALPKVKEGDRIKIEKTDDNEANKKKVRDRFNALRV